MVLLTCVSRARYVCVEPGYVRGYARVEPGRTWVGRQELSVMGNTRL